jgi:methionine synthase II (cobalamin-independent)
MHKVVKAHVAGFQKKYGLSEEDLSKQFEAFVNLAIFRSHSAETVDPKDLVYRGDDPGVDGVMIFIDDSYVSSPEEVDDIFRNRKKDAEVTIVFTQSKTSESWSKSDINTFQSAIVDFIDDDPKYPRSEYLAECREVFDAVISKVGKIRHGKPAVECYYATTARTAEDREIVAARRALKDSVEDTGLFSPFYSPYLRCDSMSGDEAIGLA